MDKRIKALFFLLVFLVPMLYVLANIRRTSGLFFPPDEFGYWENAASIVGFDWRDACFGQSYYAKGYSILLVPLLQVLNNPTDIYKGALVLNAFLFSAQGLFMFKITEEAFDGYPIYDKCIISFLCTFYPAHFVYISYTIAETLLYLLVTVIFYTLFRYEKTGMAKYAVLTFAFCVVMLLTHFRTIGIFVIVTGMIFAMKHFRNNRIDIKSLICIITVLAFIMTIVAFVISISGVRSGFDYIDDNLDRLAGIVSFQGIIALLMGVIGKLYYLAVSTFGLLFFYAKGVWRRRKESVAEVTFLIALIISIGISAVFFVGGKGIDYLVYGRYTEIFVPVILCRGLHELIEEGQDRIKPGVTCTVILVSEAVMLFVFAIGSGINSYMKDFIVGISWMFGRSMPTLNRFFALPAAVCILAIWTFIYILRVIPKSKAERILSCAVLAVFLFIGIFMSRICVYDYHDMDNSDEMLFEHANEKYDNGSKIVFLRSPWSNYVGHLQFYMYDRKLNYIEGLDPPAYTTESDAVIITYPNYEDPEQLTQRYDSVQKSAHFIMYFNEH